MTENKEDIVEVEKDYKDPFEDDAPTGKPKVQTIGSTCTSCEG